MAGTGGTTGAAENLRLIPNSHLDPVAITVTSEATDYPATYLQNSQPSWKWRSTSAAVQQITWDAGELQSADAFALIESNLTGDSTIRIELATDAGYSSLALDVTIPGKLPLYGLGEGPLGLDGLEGFSDDTEVQDILTYFFDAVTYRYGRITITDTGNPDGYVEIGKLMLGRSWQPTVNHDWGATHRRVKNSRVSRTRGGGARSSPAISYRVIAVSFSWLDEADDAELDDLIARYGSRSGVLLSAYPDQGGSREQKFSVYGLLSGWSESTRQQTDHYAQGIEVEELK